MSASVIARPAMPDGIPRHGRGLPRQPRWLSTALDRALRLRAHVLRVVVLRPPARVDARAAGVLDALVDGQDREVAGVGQAPVPVEGLQAAQLRGAIDRLRRIAPGRCRPPSGAAPARSR